MILLSQLFNPIRFSWQQGLLYIQTEFYKRTGATFDIRKDEDGRDVAILWKTYFLERGTDIEVFGMELLYVLKVEYEERERDKEDLRTFLEKTFSDAVEYYVEHTIDDAKTLLPAVPPIEDILNRLMAKIEARGIYGPQS